MFESSKFDQSGGHIRPGPDLAGFEKTARFRPWPDMISGATLLFTVPFNYVRFITVSYGTLTTLVLISFSPVL